MNKFFVSLLFFSLGMSAFTQKRIGFDFSTRLMDINTTFHYQQVLRNHFLWSVGVFHGGLGKKQQPGDFQAFLSGSRENQSPYSNVNASFQADEGTYSLFDYTVQAKGSGIQLGLGYYLPLGPKHGIRTNVNFRMGYATTKTYAAYSLAIKSKLIFQSQQNNHFFAGVSPEIYHTIRLNHRYTFYYGLKIPYYFTVDKARFNPLRTKDLMNGFESELSIGLTRNLGKCD